MDLVIVGEYSTLAEAQLAKNLLEDEGIKAQIADDASADLLHLNDPSTEVKLMVAADDANRAREVLSAAEESHAEHVAEMEEEAPED